MIGATRRWFKRNRNTIAVGVGIAGAAYFAGQYVLNKISEARERLALDQRAKENLRRRFEQNQRDCTFTVLALLPTVTENIVEALPVEQITNELQQKKAERLARTGQEGTPSELSSSLASAPDGGDTESSSSLKTSSFIHTSQMGDGSTPNSSDISSRRSKAQLWNELKISSITRALTLIYTLSLLTLFTRIQLNLLGRRNYISSVAATASPPAGSSGKISMQNNDDAQDMNIFGNDFSTNRKFLTFSWWLLHRGYKQIMTLVSDAVKEVFGPIPPTEVMTPARLSSLILEVRQKIEGTTEVDRQATRWLPYLLPPQDQESAVLVESGIITPPTEATSQSSSPPTTSSTQLRRLLDETADLIDSPHFNRINTLLLNALFSQLIDVQVLAQAFPPPSAQPNRSQNDPSSSVTIVPAHHPSSEPRTKLASILAVFTRQAHAIGDSPSANTPTSATIGLTVPDISSSSSLGNVYVDSMAREVSDLEAFAAVIYAGNLQEEGEALGNALSEESLRASMGNEPKDATDAGRSSDSLNLSDHELRESLGLEINNDSSRTSSDVVQTHLEKVWGKARDLASSRRQ